MLDTKFIEDNFELIKQKTEQRGAVVNFETLKDLIEERKNCHQRCRNLGTQEK